MEPIDRIVFGYKGLTDGVNGFIGEQIFSKFYILERIKPSLKLNNLFQSVLSLDAVILIFKLWNFQFLQFMVMNGLAHFHHME